MSNDVDRPVRCRHPECGKVWDRDPVFDVTCPRCEAAPGSLCRRPSGHVVWHNLGRGWHKARDMAAHKAGKYGPCPLGSCGVPAETSLDDYL
jgi:hypothetical protein